ncbi:type I phosphodiesterase/nucleotide pyrophosphatase [Pelomyxa schiedti]|nr:type I phosphodiesterase/nucleotide pyrophosphatase [Pelomyxa schiedti]
MRCVQARRYSVVPFILTHSNKEEWMMKNMHRMKWLVVWSCLLFDAAFLLSYVCLSGWKSSIMSCWCILNLTVTLLFSDHGATVEKHGAFNALGFIAVLFLSSIFMSTFMCFYDKKKCRPRAGWLRKLPKTTRLLEKIESDEEAHVAQFLRYHALGQTTKLNGVAMFTGHSKPKKDFLTLWELVKPKFVTGIVDNSCMEWSAKYLSRSTFPDHRLNSIWCLPEYIGSTTTDGETFNPFFGPWSFQRRCLFGKPVHMWAMEYATLFMNTYRDCPKFLLLKLTEAHEPSGMVVTAVDEGLHSFLSSLDLNTTAVVLVSDHGSHMGIPWTLGAFSSKLENRLPALFLVLPNWWLQQQRSAPGVKIPLEENEQALITPHNVFGTILDIAGVAAPSRQLSDCPVCTKSVISHRIPTNRTCSQANIPDQFCVCW